MSEQDQRYRTAYFEIEEPSEISFFEKYKLSFSLRNNFWIYWCKY
jgi:hypothetical protein